MKILNIFLVLVLHSLIGCSQSPNSKNDMKTLTEEEKKVIINKGTEAPFTGIYYKNYEKGIYNCKQCGASLFKSEAKFDSGTGWPSFDDAFEGAVKQLPDKDGRRIEIVCANCNGHLGHVFNNEGFTDKNTRHCVHSISLEFIPDSNCNTAANTASKIETAYFGSGCFWGTEYWFQKQNGVIETMVGYMGGHLSNPSYQDVCRGNTGHAEVVKVTFNPEVISFESLVKLFYETHDPEQINRQGPDVGEQYRSVIFFTNQKQKDAADIQTEILIRKGFDVATIIDTAKDFYPAEEYHRNYYEKNGKMPYCHIYTKRF
ncbi:MAG: bifunctional methionine sulfoxide reductase B/A protein [Bacteroidales bacterium]|nr:bifunctional methionine sulfoxide reductase B/A protein [Bacteroidales bacterium]